MATKSEALATISRREGLTVKMLERVGGSTKTVARWFRAGQLQGYSESALARHTGARI